MLYWRVIDTQRLIIAQHTFGPLILSTPTSFIKSLMSSICCNVHCSILLCYTVSPTKCPLLTTVYLF